MLTRRQVRWAARCAAVALCAVPATVFVGSAHADTTTCQGRPTTLVVATATGRVEGTAGDDVIVVDVAGNDIAVVDALAGDDAVCILGSGNVQLMAGPGNDTVTSVEHAALPGLVSVELGSGDDRFSGGPGRDDVQPGGGADVVSTGGGADVVRLGAGFGPATTVDVGEGDDTVNLGGAVVVTPVEGGPGTDVLRVGSAAATGPVVLDLGQREASQNDQSVAFAGFERYAMLLAVTSAARVVGTDGDDDVTVTGYSAGARGRVELSASLGGGADSLAVNAYVGGPLDGGAGTDTLTAVRDENSPKPPGARKPGVVVDLGTGSLRAAGGISADLSSFEAVSTVGHPSVTLRGGRHAESFTTDACTGSVSAGGGADRVDLDPAGRCRHRSTHVTVHGGAGRDVVHGGSSDDVLRGGPGDDVLKGRGGRDSTYGDAGRDRCVAERRISC